ncbi:Rha family transcriptional regulator [Pseudomonas alkylphenolica]|uniref:Rha family transcriptional regulator n=1 Tax=Pseudomonas alkylphenolica TaxID=237609 RepID=UPI00315DC5B4
MSSREIAELIGKNHDNVLRDARAPVKQGVLKSEETPYTHPQNGQAYPEFLLGRRDTLVLVSGWATGTPQCFSTIRIICHRLIRKR